MKSILRPKVLNNWQEVKLKDIAPYWTGKVKAILNLNSKKLYIY